MWRKREGNEEEEEEEIGRKLVDLLECKIKNV